MSDYKIEWKTSAAKELKKLDHTVRKTVTKAAERLAQDPFLPGSKQLQGFPGKRRIHFGPSNDYVIIYQVFRDRVVVEIVKVGHRSDVYKKFNG